MRGEMRGGGDTGQKGALGGISEQVIAIGIGVLMVSGMVSLGSSVMQASKAKTEMANLNHIVTGIRNLFRYSPDYGAPGDVTIAVVRGLLAPPAMRNGAAVTNQFGQNVTFTTLPSRRQLAITWPGVPSDSCVEMIASTPAAGYLSVRGNAATPITQFPVNPVLVDAAACGNAAGNTITWVIAK